MASQKAINAMSDYFNQANQVIRIQLESAVSKTTIDLQTLIRQMRATGASDDAIRAVLTNDLRESGRIFGAFRSQIKTSSSYSVGRMASFGSTYEYQKANIKEYKWQTVGKSICPDCKDRHGQVMTFEQWELSGMPKSGFSVCGSNCKCEIVPVGSWVKDQMKVPIDQPGILEMASAGKHKTVKDSLAWMKANIADQVSLRSIKDIKVANAMTKAMADVYGKFNMRKLEKIVPSRKRNGAIASANGTSLFIRQNAFTKKALREIYGNSNETYIENADKWIAYYKNQLAWLKKKGRVDIGGKIQKSVDKWTKLKADRLKYKRYTANISGKEKWEKVAQSTIHHELGHAFHDQSTRFINFRIKSIQRQKFQSMTDAEVQDWNDRWRAIYNDLKKSELKYNTSEYAMSKPSELFAECFAMYQGGERNKIPPPVLDYLEEYFKMFGN